MKLRPVTKRDKRNTAISKRLKDDVLLSNCDVIVIFSIYGQFGAIRKSNSRRMVCNTYIFINTNVLSYKTEKRIKYSQHSLHTITLSKDTIFTKICLFFTKKIVTPTKLRGSWY